MALRPITTDRGFFFRPVIVLSRLQAYHPVETYGELDNLAVGPKGIRMRAYGFVAGSLTRYRR